MISFFLCGNCRCRDSLSFPPSPRWGSKCADYSLPGAASSMGISPLAIFHRPFGAFLRNRDWSHTSTGGRRNPAGDRSPGQGRSPCDLSTNGAAAEIPLITFSLSRRNSKYAEEPLPGHGLRSSPQQDWQIATCSHNIPAHRCASPENGAAIPSQMTSLNPAISRNGDRNQ